MGPDGKGWQRDKAYTLEARSHVQSVAYTVSPARGTGDGHGNAWNSNYVTANPLGSHHGRLDLDHDTYVPDIVGQAVNAKWAKGSSGPSGPSGDEVQNMVGVSQGVRRLTPVECERLQGFPDGFTAGQSDSHRYRQLGNAVAVPVAEWLGHQLMAVNS